MRPFGRRRLKLPLNTCQTQDTHDVRVEAPDAPGGADFPLAANASPAPSAARDSGFAVGRTIDAHDRRRMRTAVS